ARGEVEVGTTPLDDEVEEIVDVQVVLELLVADHDVRAELGHLTVAGAVDHRDRPHQLAAVGDRGNDLERGRVTDRAQRRVTRRLRERDDELLTFESTGTARY